MKNIGNKIQTFSESSIENAIYSAIGNYNIEAWVWHTIRNDTWDTIWITLGRQIRNNIRTNINHKKISPATKILIEITIKKI